MSNCSGRSDNWLPPHRAGTTPSAAQTAPVALWAATMVIGGACIAISAGITISAGGQCGGQAEESKQGKEWAHKHLYDASYRSGANAGGEKRAFPQVYKKKISAVARAKAAAIRPTPIMFQLCGSLSR